MMRFFLVDTHPQDRARVGRLLVDAFPDAVLDVADSPETYQQGLARGPVDLVLTENTLGWTDAFAVLRDVQAHWSGIPVIMLAGSGSETLAVDALKAGFTDYVPKDHLDRLLPAVRDAITQTHTGLALREDPPAVSEELDAARRLQEVSVELVQADRIDALSEKILDTAVAILHADFGSIQLFYPELGEAGQLHLLGHRGLPDHAAEFWECVRATSASACGMALSTKRRVIVQDIETCNVMAGTDDQTMYLQAGIRAVQTTPLLSRYGSLLGMLSTHWREPYTPTESELHSLDILARLSADLIDRTKAEAELQRHSTDLEAERARLSTVVTEQQRSEQALRASEERYRTLFQSIDEGFCIIEVLFDAEDCPIDYRFLEANPAFERQSGFEITEGRRMREIAPHHEQHWFETYGRVARPGEPVRFQNHSAAFNRYYDVYAFRVGEPEQRRVAILFTDITQRKQIEENLRGYAAELEAANQANRALLQEVNHRVKNSLTAILGLIFAEERRLAEGVTHCADRKAEPDRMMGGVGWSEGQDAALQPHCRVALRNLSDRVSSLASVHTLLSANAWRPLHVDELVNAVIDGAASVVSEPERLVLEITGSRVMIAPEQAHHLALVISELTTNTLKHGRDPGGVRIGVDVGLEEGHVRLVYRNHGSAYPEPVLAGEGHSLGLDIVDRLVRHSLRGTWSLRNNGGPVTEIRFPVDPELNRRPTDASTV
jgi:PAS domain S-box-containing protein